MANEFKNLKTDGFLEVIHLAVEKEIKYFIEKKYEEAKNTFLKDLELEKATALAGISLQLMEKISFRSVGSELVITLIKKNEIQN